MLKLFWLGCFAILWGSGPLKVAAEELPCNTVRVGVEIDALSMERREFVEKTIQSVIKDKGSSLRIVVQYLDTEALLEAIGRNRLHLFVSSAATYRRSMLSGGRDIAVLTSRKTLSPNRNEGALVLTRLGDDSIRNWSDLINKSIVKTVDLTPTVEVALQSEISKTLSEEYQFKKILNARILSPELALMALREKRVDAVMLPMCLLEKLSEKSPGIGVGLSVFAPKQDRMTACLHSTALFPGVTVVAMPSLNPDAYLSVMRVLLSARDEDTYYSWAVATNFHSMDSALQDINADAWASYRELTWTRFLERFWAWMVGGLAILLIALLNVGLLGYLVRNKTQELRRSLEEQKQLRRDADRFRTQLEKIRRLQIVGRIAGLFAHELRQPLNAIGCYAHGIKKAVSNADDALRNRVDEGCEALEVQVQRASEVVERIRDYVKSKSASKKIYSLINLAKASVRDFKTASAEEIPIDLVCENERKCDIYADAMEIELVIVNLMRNAAQAQENQKNAWITLYVEGDDETVTLRVTDNGPSLSNEALSNIVSTCETSKSEGLGLGLTLARDLVAAHNGFIRYSLSSTRSLVVEVVFPRVKEEK